MKCFILCQEEVDRIKETIFSEIENMFDNTPATKHLVLEHKIFINAMAPKDPGYIVMKEILVDLLSTQPSWGEKLPKAWIHLKMMINRKVEKGETVMSIETLGVINHENPVKELSDRELGLFLRLNHSQGEIIYFSLPGLRDQIVISPKFLVDALRSFVTDIRFCKGQRQKAIQSMNQNGILLLSDINDIWNGKKNFLKHKQYLLSLMGHLDIIATPRQYGESGALIKTDVFYVPSLVKTVFETQFLDERIASNAIGLSIKFNSKILPSAIGNRLIASCINIYPIQNYDGTLMLFSGLVILSVKPDIDLCLVLRQDRVDVYLCHRLSRSSIKRESSAGILECLKDMLVSILESYRVTSTEGKVKHDVPFHTEFVCFDISSPCYDRTKVDWMCRHGHTITTDIKSRWFINRVCISQFTVKVLLLWVTKCRGFRG